MDSVSERYTLNGVNGCSAMEVPDVGSRNAETGRVVNIVYKACARRQDNTHAVVQMIMRVFASAQEDMSRLGNYTMEFYICCLASSSLAAKSLSAIYVF